MFVVALVLAAFLVWFGAKFFFWPTDKLSANGLYLLGVLLAFAGVIVMGTVSLKNHLAIGAAILVCGFYTFARAAGLIEFPWLTRLIGASAWVAAFMAVFMAFPRQSRSTGHHSSDSDD